jgi:hypothetical protein
VITDKKNANVSPLIALIIISFIAHLIAFFSSTSITRHNDADEKLLMIIVSIIIFVNKMNFIKRLMGTQIDLKKRIIHMVHDIKRDFTVLYVKNLDFWILCHNFSTTVAHEDGMKDLTLRADQIFSDVEALINRKRNFLPPNLYVLLEFAMTLTLYFLIPVMVFSYGWIMGTVNIAVLFFICLSILYSVDSYVDFHCASATNFKELKRTIENKFDQSII